ncbi:putative polygalacturonase-like [Dorcoceras hygrometricum]|uniref:Putative polygalacturonase-like n=1 Tax=Dorcoceras hygrometricum TaxID=472368 RepID=A0A2Z7CY95_9LAMI|nr:putative polygalacturonase-like [Dorcoceras hygrometricum]
MCTPSDSTAESLDSVPSSPEAREPMLPDQAELDTSSPPWYKEKTSNLRLSDISLIKEKGGMLDKFEVVLPCPDEADFKREEFVSNGFNLNRGYFKEDELKEEDDDCSAVAVYVGCTVHQQRENESESKLSTIILEKA